MRADRSSGGIEVQDRRLAWRLVLPALGVMVLIAIFPLAWTPYFVAEALVRAWRTLRRGVKAAAA